MDLEELGGAQWESMGLALDSSPRSGKKNKKGLQVLLANNMQYEASPLPDKSFWLN